MNKKSILALMALLLMAALLLLGLPFTADRIVADRMEQTVVETATPAPIDDDDEQ